MVDALLWYVWTQAFAAGGWAVSSQWLRRLPDRGYAVSKALGMLLGGFLYWMVVSLGAARNDPGAVILALLLLPAISLALRRFRKTTQGGQEAVLPRPRMLPTIICVEVIFTVAFIGCAVYRSYNPDITSTGGEKFMESMYLNAIVRSPTFPPNDAWLAGFPISYYYFGYIILAMLTKVSGIAGSIAFNLGGAMIFALAITSAYGVGFDLWHTYQAQIKARLPSLRSAVLAGLLTATMLGVMGNQGGLMESIRCTHILPDSFWSWLDVRQIARQPVECAGIIPTRFYWWWDWSRVIHDYTPTGADQEVITETPSFSFILGDNHPHVMSLAYVLLALAIALNYVSTPIRQGASQDRGAQLDGFTIPAWFRQHTPDIFLAAVVLGGLSFMNTWDFPVYGSLVVGAILLRRYMDRLSLLPGIVFGLAVFILGYLLYLPFYATFASQARGIGVNLFNGTRFVQFFLMFAPFLLAIVFYLGAQVLQSTLKLRTLAGRTLGLLLAALAFSLFAAVVLGLLSAQGRAYLSEMNTSGTVMGVTRDTVVQRLLQRVTDPWVVLFLFTTAAICVTLLLTHSTKDGSSPPAGTPPQAFVMMLILAGALLAAAVEFIFLQDLFGTRMNTVFKFYYQAWTLWAVAGAFTVLFLLDIPRAIARAGAAAIVLFVLSGLLFPLYAALSKTNNFSGTPTLDGSAYLARTNPDDWRMINWLNQHVAGDPTILEAPAAHYGAYLYNGRISTFTGLPTLLGWGGHENQWHGNYTEPARREPYIQTLYDTTDLTRADEILRQFKVKYVIVGQLERAQYSAEGLAKFARICNVAYETGNSAIYRCNQ